MDGFRMYYITLSHTISKREKKMHSLLDAESKQKKICREVYMWVQYNIQKRQQERINIGG